MTESKETKVQQGSNLKIVWILLCFMLTTQSYSTETNQSDLPQITIAAENSWPPFSDESGEGISKRIATAAFEHSGYQIETLVMPYSRALKATELGHVDACWNVTRQSNTDTTYHFGEEALLKASISFYYRADSTLNYQSVTDIPNNTDLGVILGYEYGDDYEQQKHRLNPQTVSTQTNLLKMLLADRFDIILMFDEVFNSTTDKLKLNPDLFKQGKTFYTSDIFIAFNAKSPDSKRYSQALDKGLRYLRESGQYDRLIKSQTISKASH